MQYKALVSFSGLISMGLGEVREIKDKAVAKDLLEAGYVEQVGDDSPAPEKARKAAKKGGDAL